MADRKPILTRNILLISADKAQSAIRLISNMPIDQDKPIEVVIREQVKARKPDQNALMWAGPLRDIEEQAWVDGRQYSAEVWHEHFKRKFLPEEDSIDLHELVKDPSTWQKWAYTPGGERVCIGSTKDLTVKGFSTYLEQMHSAGAEMGVMFHANPKEVGR